MVLLEDILEGKAPNAGRFCGACYHPLTPESDSCAHCGSDSPPVSHVPDEVVAMFKAKRSREGLVVRSVAWTGLTLGVVLGLVPLAFYGVTWWTAAAFFGAMLVLYIASANLANSIGDALGYRWGQAELRRRWAAFVRERDG